MARTRLLQNVLSIIAVGFLIFTQPVLADLPPGNAVTDATAILRNALPIKQEEIQNLQHKLESTRELIRGNRWPSLAKIVSSSKFLITSKNQKIIAAIPKDKSTEAETLFNLINKNLDQLELATEAQNKDAFIEKRDQTLKLIGEVETLLVGDFPFQIPEEYNALPRLLGRASVDIRTTQGTIKAVIDGYNAPITSGAFIDLAIKGFYDGLPFTRAEDFYILQTGDPEGPEVGYIDPSTNKLREIPLEIRSPDKVLPFYGQSFEELGLYKTTPVLPFSASGTLGWAHSNASLNDGSSQFFMFLYEAELTPAGRNLIDGRNAAFGYVVDGNEILEKLGVNDEIISVKVTDGKDRLAPHG
ncbi:peptidylprolyl isomerase [Prochlorococcus sp. MIT 1341]|uniref:peptidylprolyl isomerase n=1 Tax=Prochlorococcus sp. MIT 1341 TaxID=3096221 RepID=UPI002A75959C|nr:peptidylprolyl isomerase [Prochlorococcus sp. MIT 1341]